VDYFRIAASIWRMDRRFVYLLLALAIIVPLILVPNPRVEPTEESMRFHRAVETLKQDDIVLLSTDYDAGSSFELEPMTTALVRHLFEKGAKLVVLSLNAQGTGMVHDEIGYLTEELGMEYGRDWVFLGYRPSAPPAILSLASAPYTVFPEDFEGNRLTGMPLTDHLRGFTDFALVAVIASGATARDWVIYGQGRFQAPIILGLAGGIGPTFQGFFETHQVEGLLAGLRGAAEYEQMTEHPREALRVLSTQSTAHLLLVVLVVIGNISFLLSRWMEGPLP